MSSSWTPGDEELVVLDDEVVLSMEPPPVPIASDELEEEPTDLEDELLKIQR